MKCELLPIVGYDFGKQARKDAEVADGKHVDVDHVAQTVSNCDEITTTNKTTVNKTQPAQQF